MKDYFWGVSVRIANRLQEYGFLSSRLRDFLRSIGHLFISPPEKRLLNIKFGFQILTPKGLKGSRSYATATYEERLSNFLNNEIKEGENFLDIGAFIGFYTCLAAKRVGKNGHVWAFEPEEGARKILRHNVRINNYKNVTIVGSAIGGADGTANFVASNDLGIGPAGGFVTNDSSKKNSIVSVQKLDSFFKTRPDTSIDWLKLDVDGHELQALDGMFSISKRSPKLKLILEVDPSHFSSSEHMSKLYTKLLALGFQKGFISERNFDEISLSAPPFMYDHNLNVIFKKT